jgi:hypothetical protein
MPSDKPIPPRVRDAILQSLKAGVVPRIGQQHIQVGRVAEVKALVSDIERVADGGSTVRFVIGEYGSGKTFFLHLVRSIALERKLVTAHADLAPDRRLHASGGQARSLYQELMANLSTRSKPEGGALSSVVERFITSALAAAKAEGTNVESVIRQRLQVLSEMVGGYDFAEVIAAYWRGHDQGNDELKTHALRWLRAEFSSKTDARNALGVRTIIDDTNVYDMLELFAKFVALGGFDGLLVCLDELVNLYKLGSGRARKTNYEQILRIVNDGLQGSARHIGFLFGGTPEFLYDTRKGPTATRPCRAGWPATASPRTAWLTFPAPSFHSRTCLPRICSCCCRTSVTSRQRATRPHTWFRTKPCTPSCATAPPTSVTPISRPRATPSSRSSGCWRCWSKTLERPGPSC